jgi:hypothetical protein
MCAEISKLLISSKQGTHHNKTLFLTHVSSQIAKHQPQSQVDAPQASMFSQTIYSNFASVRQMLQTIVHVTNE